MALPSCFVSIHAPGRGATFRLPCTCRAQAQFQFTHPGGVRPLPERYQQEAEQFQFTHPGGVRQGVSGRLYGDIVVSIHAPGRGATLHCKSSPKKRKGFNSRTREGCDTFNGKITAVVAGFNSRTREGCDGKPYSIRSVGDLFQFTHPGGVRLHCTASPQGWGVFQFTHPGGVRRNLTILHSASHLFQFTHPGGVRQVLCWHIGIARKVSIHAPGRGATISMCESSTLRLVFQFTHPGGVRRRHGRGEAMKLEVSIHAPGRGATRSPRTRLRNVMFQFTHPGGVRLMIRIVVFHRSKFQFTHPGGVRRPDILLPGLEVDVSIHAPGRGAT